ncbi:Alpha/Beta hydrolase protein [Tricharina praecox]|uniref:Alpha/Beta hydrolase protein n=1 Tax=Tricharina praecox TaxID=43433 RepID=UPI00221FDE36|nr:Alpha/Beta hydrolase protein [Tricharina praecox]KAI5848786.1 Alpha/Beta hydrolase protein [Tricharina praecox]
MESPDPTSASTSKYPPTVLTIGGLSTTIHGLNALPPATQTCTLTAVHLLHPRLQTSSYMTPLACSILDAAISPTICISFDQRNHGTRSIDPIRNEAWRQGNDTHAIDLLASYAGTARDLAGVIDFLSAYLGRKVERHIVAGVSLGGHAAWIAVTQDPRIEAAGVIIGCADYCALMRHRAEKSRLNAFSIGACAAFPEGLLDTAKRLDPAAMGVKEVARRLQGKRVLCLSGGADKLVPYDCNRGFLEELKGAQGVEIVDKVYEGVGHECTPAMIEDLAQWVREVVEKWNGRIEVGKL